MNWERTVVRASLVGIILNWLGLLLPWGRESWGESLGAFGDALLGFQLVVGSFVLIGCVITTVLFGIYVKRKHRSWLYSTLLGELIVLGSSLIWILDHDAISWRWMILDDYDFVTSILVGMRYEVLYGVYVTVIGSFIAIIAIINGFMRIEH